MEAVTTDVASLIRDLGLPAVVLLWFMFRMEKKIDRLSDAVTALVGDEK